MDIQGSIDLGEFTEDGFRDLLKSASRSYCWRSYGTSETAPHIILRHDVDHSPQRALALARIEAEEGVTATFLVMLRSSFYNFLEKPIADIFRQIAPLGHEIGLHFDMSYYGDLPSLERLEEKVREEKDLVERTLETRCGALSFHNPDTNSSLDFRQETISGLYNAYSQGMVERYKYVSDSNGYWRFDSAFEVAERAEHERVHMLIHPEWWTPEPMSPRNRILRAAQGRADAAMSDYDALLARWNRVNVK